MCIKPRRIGVLKGVFWRIHSEILPQRMQVLLCNYQASNSLSIELMKSIPSFLKVSSST